MDLPVLLHGVSLRARQWVGSSGWWRSAYAVRFQYSPDPMWVRPERLGSVISESVGARARLGYQIAEAVPARGWVGGGISPP